MSNELDSFRDHMDQRLDRLENKLDDHLQRLTAAEVALEFVKGHLKITTAIGIAVFGTIATWWFTQVTGG